MYGGVMPTPPEYLRCTFVKRNGSRCKQEIANDDSTLCHFHIAMTSRDEEIGQKLNVLRHNTVNVLNVSPMQVLLEEVQRSQLMVAWLEQCIAEKDADELLTSITTENRDGGPGGGFTSEKREDRASAVLVAYNNERAHLAHITRLALQSGIEEKQLELNQQLATTVILAMQGFARLLGHDPGSGAIRSAMSAALKSAQEGRTIEGEVLELPAPDQEAETAAPGLAPPVPGKARAQGT